MVKNATDRIRRVQEAVCRSAILAEACGSKPTSPLDAPRHNIQLMIRRMLFPHRAGAAFKIQSAVKLNFSTTWERGSFNLRKEIISRNRAIRASDANTNKYAGKQKYIFVLAAKDHQTRSNL